MTEAVGCRFAEGIEITVADVNILLIGDLYAEFLFSHRLVLGGEIREVMGGRVIVVVKRPGVRQLPGGAHVPVQQLHERVARTHARKARVQYRVDPIFLDPAHLDGIADVEDSNRAGEGAADLFDHGPLRIRQVIAALHGAVIQKLTGAAGDQDQRRILLRFGFCQKLVRRADVFQSGIQRGDLPVHAEGAVFLDRLMEVCLPTGIDQTRTGRRVAEDILRRAKAVERGVRLQRQDAAFVFQQHHALPGGPDRHFVMSGVEIVLLRAGQRFKAQHRIGIDAPVRGLEAGEAHRILFPVFPRHAADRHHQTVALDDHIHQEALATRNLDAIHCNYAIAILG